jgi:hypothetical protein
VENSVEEELRNGVDAFGADYYVGLALFAKGDGISAGDTSDGAAGHAAIAAGVSAGA